jgi:hypothetical protein
MPDTEILPTSDPAGARIAALRQAYVAGNAPTDEDLLDLWHVAGGVRGNGGVNIPTGMLAMQEDLLLPMLRTMLGVR